MGKLLFAGRDDLLREEPERYVRLEDLTGSQSLQVAERYLGNGYALALLKRVGEKADHGEGNYTFLKGQLALAYYAGGRAPGDPGGGSGTLVNYRTDMRAGLALYHQVAGGVTGAKKVGGEAYPLDQTVYALESRLSPVEKSVIGHLGDLAVDRSEARARLLMEPALYNSETAQLKSNSASSDPQVRDLAWMRHHRKRQSNATLAMPPLTG